MFHMGLATPCATVVQVTMFLICFRIVNRRLHKESLDGHA